jgi:hypothetical protein
MPFSPRNAASDDEAEFTSRHELVYSPAWRLALRQIKQPAKSRSAEERLLFVNKKKQKNFVKLGPCRFIAQARANENFCAAFDRKSGGFPEVT